jgi:tetratricopeptide (TPR) repeat protein
MKIKSYDNFTSKKLNSFYNDIDGGIADFNKAISIKPDYAEPYCNRGNVYFKEKEYREALRDINGLVIIPGDKQALSLNWAVSYALKHENGE